MGIKFQNKYRIPSARLQNWDYGANAAYFITICTQNREHFFGEIVDTECIPSHKMQLSEIGKLAETEWLKTVELRPDMNLELGEFIVMPNHFHAIIIIGKNEYNSGDGGGRDAMHCGGRDAMHCVSTDAAGKFGPQSKNLASIVRGFKSAVTKNGRFVHPDFSWQPRFHDPIIRNTQSFENIQNYIANNPANWNKDKFF